jgi:hypothetical protein
MVNVLVNIALPVVILLTLSGDDRLGPIPALLIAIGIPASHALVTLVRARTVTIQSILGLVSVLLTGVIGVLRLDTALFPLKEAAIPLAFAVVLVASNHTSFPVVKLLFDVVQRKEYVERQVRATGVETAYRAHIERCGLLWAGIMALSGAMKATLAALIVRADAGTEAFNRQLATYELAQIPTSMLVTMVLVLSLIWNIAKGTGEIISEPPGKVLRGGHRLERIAMRISAIVARFQRRPRKELT